MASADEQLGEPIDILLVEPNRGDTRLFEENFRNAKVLNTIHSVTDGESALDYVHQRGEYADKPCPDIILLEPQLPGKSGREVLQELKNDPELSDIPVVVLTGSDAEKEIVQSHGLDADTYIKKPIKPEDFVDFVQEVEEFWFAIVQQAPEQG
ncbi:response regulator [Halopiger aswanensis]|uniref:Response regulator receiver domain-containing protein n=1 Tax=Halopiger aswanensis TaxID=148449 RepID=A0A3R7GEQ7_9EURY|nr:response regulator [Halopiger aswanensis]RKD85236.1 response regulator receiver domain-containing protein [Halopiger aswanensis]